MTEALDNAFEKARQDLSKAFTTLVNWTEPRTGETLKQTHEHVENAYKTASHILGTLHEGARDPWTGSKIHKIIRKSARFIVFLDDSLNIKWWWVLRPNMAVISAVQARITELTHESAFLVDERTKVKSADGQLQHTREAENIRAVIGEAMAIALNDGKFAECEKVFSEAEVYMAVAKDQRCRPQFVFVFVLAVLACVAIAFARYSGWLGAALQGNVVAGQLTEAAVAGAFGALISAVSRTTQLQLEPAAGMSGIAVEAVARALIGAAAGILVDLAFEGGLLVKAALDQTRPQLQESVRLFLCLSAGVSERILPALVGKAEVIVTRQDKTVTTHSTAHHDETVTKQEKIVTKKGSTANKKPTPSEDTK
jgi:hypothetical protein